MSGLAVATRRLAVAMGALLVAAPAAAAEVPAFFVPGGWPAPRYGFEHNAPTPAGVELGRRLFYDPQLSADGRIACASCHQQAAAFAHPRHRVSHGIGDRLGTRNAPALFNLAWQPDFMWDGAVRHLELQPLAPLTNAAEMGATLPDALARLRRDPAYPPRFAAAFGSPAIDSQRMLRALAQFLGSLVSADSPYDRAQRTAAPLDAQARRGQVVFRAHCASCHAEPLFTDFSYRDNGLDAAPKDPGRGAISDRAEDRGKFRVPSLRNVALTAPYMHDGRFDTLEDVVDHYMHGVQHSAGVDPLLATPIALDTEDRRALIAFLHSLTDDRFVHDARFGEPAMNEPARSSNRFARWWRARRGASADPAPVDAAPTTHASITQRFARRVPPLEIVAVRDRDAVRVWIDDERSNAPRSGLDLRMDVGSYRMRASEEAPGRYRIPFDPAIPPSTAVLDVREADGTRHRLELPLPALTAGGPREG